MTAANTTFKIKDTKTGLYWGGGKGFEKVGTRFVTQGKLGEAIARIRRENRNSWPMHYIVETVQLTETVVGSRTGPQVIVDHAFTGLMREAISKRGCEFYHAEAAASVIDEMRRTGGFNDAPYMVLAPTNDRDGNPVRSQDLRAFLKANGGDPLKVKKMARGWWTVADLSTATLMRMNGDVTMMIDVNKNVEDVARILKSSPEELVRIA